MSVKGFFRKLYLIKIKKYTHNDLIIDHLRRVGMKIGNNCCIYSTSLETTEPYLIKIGNDVTIADGVRFLTHDDSPEFYYKRGSLIVGRVIIGNNVFIGAESIIMPGVTIADNVIIGAGSVVTHSIKDPGSVAVGVPAHIVSNVEILREKNKDLYFMTEGMNFEEKKKYILSHEERLKRSF